MSTPIQVLSLKGLTVRGTIAETIAAGFGPDAPSALESLADLGLPARVGARLEGVADFDDDPALRILGRHGRALEPVLRAAHTEGRGAQVARERIGLFLALGMVDAEPDDLVPAVRASRDAQGNFDLQRFFGGAFRSIHPLWPLAMLNNVAAGQFAIDLDIRGDNLVLASDADAGVRAVLEAMRAIQAGTIDAAVVGGSAEAIGAFGMQRFELEGRGADYEPGEGCGAWLLASTTCASAIGATPRARLLGAATAYGATPDGSGATEEAWSRAIDIALADANLGPAAVQIAVHGPLEPGLDRALSSHQGFWRPGTKLGELGPAQAFVAGALSVETLPSGSIILVLAGSASGAVGALVLEAA